VFLRPDEPFTWASGIKSPIYCDNRLTLSAPERAHADVEQAIADTVKTHYREADCLMGTSTAGIPHAAIAAHLLGLPMGYVRSGAKDHGRHNRIEGRLDEGWNAVVVEDLISTGGSVIDVVDALREAGANGCWALSASLPMACKKGLDRLAQAQVTNISLTNFDTVVRVAAQQGRIAENDIARLIAFRDNPGDTSWIANK
jgi:orotate phosphoribosyltransferase